MMDIKQFRTGGDRNFGYLAADTGSSEAVVIDPSYAPEVIAAYAADHGYIIRYVFSTHGHHDHCNGNAALERLCGVKAMLYRDQSPEAGLRVVDGAVFPLGGERIHILHTPGHTEDSICIHVGNDLFTGDTLFVGKVGGTGTAEEAEAEYHSLHERLMTLKPETVVWPGHDYGAAPVSSIGREKSTNPFLLQPDFSSFLELKRDWAAYKKAHGIS